MDLLDNVKNAANISGGKKEYSLTEVVGILSMIQEGMKIADIRTVTGRSVHSLRYKFFEKTVLKGKEKCRSVMQYSTIAELYEAHGARYSEEDLQSRVNEFKVSLQKKIEG